MANHHFPHHQTPRTTIKTFTLTATLLLLTTLILTSLFAYINPHLLPTIIHSANQNDKTHSHPYQNSLQPPPFVNSSPQSSALQTNLAFNATRDMDFHLAASSPEWLVEKLSRLHASLLFEMNDSSSSSTLAFIRDLKKMNGILDEILGGLVAIADNQSMSISGDGGLAGEQLGQPEEAAFDGIGLGKLGVRGQGGKDTDMTSEGIVRSLKERMEIVRSVAVGEVVRDVVVEAVTFGLAVFIVTLKLFW